MRPLTPRQQAILSFVSDFGQHRGYAPSLREIGEAVGLTNVSAVRGHVAALERKGYLTKLPDQPRSITVLGRPSLISRIKRKLHEFAKTDEGVLHRVQYGLVLATQGLRPVLQREARKDLEKALGNLAAEHGWKLIEKRIQPDHLVLVVEAWPNHSPELAARRVRATTEHALRRRLAQIAPPLWAKGYAITTNLGEMDEIVRQFLAASGQQQGHGGGKCDSF